MARGGARPGAGRKQGSVTKRTREVAERAVTEGITPLDYMLKLLRDDQQPQAVRFEAAKHAAPFIHPKLSSVDTTLNGSLQTESTAKVDPEELREAFRAVKDEF